MIVSDSKSVLEDTKNAKKNNMRWISVNTKENFVKAKKNEQLHMDSNSHSGITGNVFSDKLTKKIGNSDHLISN